MSSSLPPAIARQVAEADNIVNTLSAQPATPEPPAPTPAPVSETPPPAPTPAPAPADDPNSETWAQRFRTLQGITAQQANRMREQEQAHQRQVAELQSLLQELKAAKAEKPAEKQAADPKDVETFGADLVEMVQRYAERVFQSMAAQFGGKAAELETRITAVEQQVTGVSKKTELTREQQFYATLDVLVPSWKQVNEQQRWLQWLGEMDPVYGAPRQAALDIAFEALDAKRVAAIFNTFLTQHPPAQKESLAAQVAPPTAAAPAPAVSPPPKRIFTEKEVLHFYNEKAKGRLVGPEADRMAAEIELAAAENRIR